MSNNQNTMLTPDEILKALNTLKDLPVDILKAAAANREALAPLFVNEINKYIGFPPFKRINAVSGAAFFGFHFLGEWNEKSAYRTAASLLRIPSVRAYDFFGDASTETTPRVMASLFDGDPQPIIDIILDGKAYDAIRASMFDALIILVRENRISRENHAAILRDIFDKLESCRESFVWDGWMTSVAMAGLKDMVPLVRRVFDEQRLEDYWMDFEDFDRTFQYGLVHPYHLQNEGSDAFSLWTNTVDEFLSMEAVFDFGNENADEQGDSDNVIHVNFRAKGGRYALCPCGSGEKFRQCCGKLPIA